MTNRTVTVELVTKFKGAVAGVATFSAALHDLGGELDQLQKKHKESFNKITNTTAVAGLALTGVFAAVVKSGMAFDKQMSEVGAVSGATGKQLSALSAAALKAGKDTVFSATQAAQAEAELAKAGVSTADILGGGLTGALNLAAAGSLDLADAATISAQAMNIFGLSGKAVPHIADVLSAAANTSAADVGQLGQALNQSGLVAHQYGLTLEQTTGTLAAFAQSGLNGSDAGTSFKTMLQALNPTSLATKGVMKELGISFYDAKGQFIGITGVAGVLQAKLKGLTQEQRNAALAQIFGSDAVRAANVLYTSGAAGLQKWIDGVNQSGAAAATARAKLNNLAGDVEQLKGSLETLAITSSGGARDGLRQLTQAATGTVNAFADLPNWIQQGSIELAGIAGVSLLAGTGFVKARGALNDLKESLTEMGPLGGKAATGIGKVGGALGKAGLWGVAAFAAYEGIKALADVIDQRHGPVVRDVDAMTDAFTRFAATGQVTGEMAKAYGKDLAGITVDIKAITAAQTQLNQINANRAKTDYNSKVANRYSGIAQDRARAGESQAVVDFGASDESLTNLVNNGQALAARANFDVFRVQATAAGKSANWIYSQFPKYTAASNDLARANGTTAASMMTVTAAGKVLTIGLDESVSSGAKLVDVLNSLSGANEDYGKSNIAAEQALADLNRQLKDNDKNQVQGRKSLSDSTQAGRDNLNMILATIDTDKQQFQTLYNKKLQTEDSTAALKDATAQYDAYIGRLRTALLNEGFNATQVDELLKLYAAIPPVASTTVTAPGLVEVNDTASGYKRLMDQMDGRTVTTDFLSRFESSGAPPSQFHHGLRWGGAYEHAADGALRQAQISSAVAGPGARYAYAEGTTGGEAFIPRHGDYARSMGIAQTVAGWLGASIVPWRTRGGDGASSPVTYHSQMNVYAQKADPAVLDQYMRGLDVRQRVGRPH